MVKLTKPLFESLQVGEILFLRGHVVEKDCPRFKGYPSVYFGKFETLEHNFVRSKYYAIKLDETKDPILFTKVDGKLIPQLDNNNLDYGQEVYLSTVVATIHEKDWIDPWDYKRILVKTGTSLNDITKQCFLLCSPQDFQAFVEQRQ